MGNTRYTEEFKKEAVKQVTERGYTRTDVSERIGVSMASLARWIREYSDGLLQHGNTKRDDKDTEIIRLKAELKRVSEERDILKKAAVFFANHPE